MLKRSVGCPYTDPSGVHTSTFPGGDIGPNIDPYAVHGAGSPWVAFGARGRELFLDPVRRW